MVPDSQTPNNRTIRSIALSAIVILAATLRFANLEALSYANHYYTAAVVSMLQSWHNFFFVAAEPGGLVSVDKPPLGLWLQAISAYFFGVNGFAVLLPQILTGILAVIVIYHLVRRSFGTMAGLLAALALAITPIVVATDRNNTSDSPLTLALLLAAWAFIKATEQGKLRYLFLGATLVGVGFNIKMLAAFLPLPAFYALYLLGSVDSLWRKLINLGLASLLLLVVSLSWVVAVDLTPADQRPYVGGSGDNSVMNLAIGYNGVERLLGAGSRRGAVRLDGPPNNNWQPPAMRRPFPQPGNVPNNPPLPPGNGALNPPWQPPALRPPFSQPGNVPNNPPLQPAPGGMRPPAGQTSPFRDQAPVGSFRGRPGGGMDTGQAGLLRLFLAPLSNQMSWLLPFGLISILALACSARLRWPVAPPHQAALLWGGWLLIGSVFFSIALFFHPYYLSMLAPPLAALVGIGIAEIWRVYQQRPWLATACLLIGIAATLAFQVFTAQTYTRSLWWIPIVIGLFISGTVLLLVASHRRLPHCAQIGFGCLIAAILLTPGIWSAMTMFYASENQSLPSAYTGGPSGPANRGGLQVNQKLLAYLEQHTQGFTYLMAVPSSMQGADYVIATGRPVLYLGGFNGQDRVVSRDDLERMVKDGELRYIYWNTPGGNLGGQVDISTWVVAQCKPVPGFETATRNAGAPDGTLPGFNNALPNGLMPGGMQFPGARDMQVSLYDCGG